MDQLTHTATGFLLSRAGLNRSTPHAAWILVLAANAPDMDIVTLAGGQLSYLNYHRHLTHALVALPVMALLPVLVVRLLARGPFRWRGAYAISCVGVASHLLLDYTNVYGIRLFLPFSARWFHLDLNSLADLWIWAVYLMALAAPALVRLVNAEIGAPGTGAARGFAIFALALVALYDGGRAVAHARAVAMLDARMYAGAAPLRVAAIPGAVNPLAWRGLVETRESYIVEEVSLLEEYDPARGATFYKAEPGPAITAANGTAVFRDFFRFAQYPLERTAPVAEPENGTEVEAVDMRFGTPVRPAFVARAILSGRMEVLQAWFSYGAVRPR